MIDLKPAGGALDGLFLGPVVCGQERTNFADEVGGDALQDTIGGKAADETCHCGVACQLVGGQIGVRDGLAAAPEGDLWVRLNIGLINGLREC